MTIDEVSKTVSITVDLPLKAIVSYVSDCWEAAFHNTSFARGDLRDHVQRQVYAHVKAMDLAPLIAKMSQERLEAIVRDEVGKAMQKMVREKTREHLQKLLDMANEELPLEAKP